MNGFDLLEAVGGVDPAYVEHAESSAAQYRLRERTVRIVAAAAACAAVAIVAIGVTTMGKHSIREPDSLYGEEGSVVCDTEGVGSMAGDVSVTGTVPENDTSAGSSTAPVSVPSTEPLPEAVTGTPEAVTGTPDDGAYSGGVTTPAVLAENAPAVRGTGYTAAEIAELLRREGYAVAQMAASETGCAAGDVRILTEGYCHTSLGAENVVDLDYLTIPVCVGNRVVASVDLFRVDGEVHYSVSAGGSRWDNINRALAYGEVAFAYAGYGELAVAADGTVFDITVDASQAVAGTDDLYARAASPYTVFSLSALQSADRVSPGT